MNTVRSRITEHEAIIERLRNPRAGEDAEDRNEREDRLAVFLQAETSLKSARLSIQRQLNMTREGLSELEAKADKATNPLEREQARWDLEQARADTQARSEQANHHRRAARALTSELTAIGVPEQSIKAILALASNDTGVSSIRSYNYYVGAHAKAVASRKALDADHEAKEDEILNADMSPAAEEKALEKEELRYKKAVKAANRRIANFALGRDCTVQGQQELLERATARYDEWTELREEAEARGDIAKANEFLQKSAAYFAKQNERYLRVQRLRNTAMSERKRREQVRKEIKAVAQQFGGDAKKVIGAWNKPPLTVIERMDPMDLRSSTKVHLTEKDNAKIDAAFERSPEFKQHGQDGFTDYAARRVLESPVARMPKAETLNDVHATAEIFDQGKKGRHKTTQEGKRETSRFVAMTKHEQDIVRARASAFEMSTSSYVRAMLLGKNPFQIQNDRSQRNWERKRDACREVLANPGMLAAA